MNENQENATEADAGDSSAGAGPRLYVGSPIERQWADRDAALIAEVQAMVTNLNVFILEQHKLANLEATKAALMELSDRLGDTAHDTLAVVAIDLSQYGGAVP